MNSGICSTTEVHHLDEELQSERKRKGRMWLTYWLAALSLQRGWMHEMFLLFQSLLQADEFIPAFEMLQTDLLWFVYFYRDYTSLWFFGATVMVIHGKTQRWWSGAVWIVCVLSEGHGEVNTSHADTIKKWLHYHSATPQCDLAWVIFYLLRMSIQFKCLQLKYPNIRSCLCRTH